MLELVFGIICIVIILAVIWFFVFKKDKVGEPKKLLLIAPPPPPPPTKPCACGGKQVAKNTIQKKQLRNRTLPAAPTKREVVRETKVVHETDSTDLLVAAAIGYTIGHSSSPAECRAGEDTFSGGGGESSGAGASGSWESDSSSDSSSSCCSDD